METIGTRLLLIAYRITSSDERSSLIGSQKAIYSSRPIKIVLISLEREFCLIVKITKMCKHKQIHVSGKAYISPYLSKTYLDSSGHPLLNSNIDKKPMDGLEGDIFA